MAQYCGRVSSPGSLAIFAAIRRASSRVSRLAAVRRKCNATSRGGGPLAGCGWPWNLLPRERFPKEGFCHA
jgi:hypothetical protein